MSKNKLSLRKINSTQEVVKLLQKDLKNLKERVKGAGKLEGAQRRTAIRKIDRKDVNNINNLLMSLQTSILTKQEDKQYELAKEIKKEYEQCQNKFHKLQEQLQFIRHQGQQEEEIFLNRNLDTVTTKQEYAQKIEKAQADSEQAVKNMLKMLHQTKQIGNTVNQELQRQLEALDSVNQQLQQTQSTMERALRHINYFARSVYTDKLLILLIVLILLAIVAIIILSAMGKVSGPTQDILT